MSSMKTTRTPEDWAKVDPLYLMQRVARGETSGTAAYNLMRDALADIASLAQRCRELEEKLEKAHQATNDECMDWAREYERRKDAEAERDTLRGLLAECAEYLNTNNLTSIGHGSILHRKMIDAAMEAPR